MDKAAFDHENIREERSIKLDQVREGIKADLESTETIMSEVPGIDPIWDAAYNLHQRLLTLEDKGDNLDKELHCNDLPPLPDNNTKSNPQNCSEVELTQSESADTNPKRFPQDSSDIHQTDFDSSDYYDD